MNARSCLLLLSSLALGACGANAGISLFADTEVTGETAAADTAPETTPPEETVPEVAPPETTPEETFDFSPPEDVEPGCEPGQGCFGDPCGANDECLSGYCVEHLGDRVCSQTCTEECPAGWTCRQVGSGPDVVFLCISDYPVLCKPCTANADCMSQGAEDACVAYGDQGSFCGGTCQGDTDCPWGFSCKDAKTVAGADTKQCTADAGVCPCTVTSITLGLHTPCQAGNEFGTCQGKRVCTAEGLAPCDAAVPAEEACNGLDEDCDGEVDEPTNVRGQFVGLCDDGNDCTQDTCLGEAGCDYAALDDVECKDGNPCTIADTCDAGLCVGTPVQCDDYNPCTDDSCDDLGGCVFTPNASDCDDGDPCTVNDTCGDAQCVGFAVSCDCQSDADCGKLEDGNLCNGTLVCDTAKLPYQCAVAAGTVVKCPAPTGKDAVCLAPACDPDTGECSFAPGKDGVPCDDADACTINDTCASGACAPGKPANCNDGNPCTDDACDPLAGCTHSPNTAACNDGNACTTADQCAAGSCFGGPGLVCNDGNGCTDDSCSPQTGCVFAPNQAPCSDGNACTDGDHCQDGSCVTLGPTQCTDGNPCTNDSCDPALGCSYTINDAPCSDDDPCTLNDTCANGTCQPGPEVDCNDLNPCTDDTCGPAGICLHKNNTAACNDGNACTLNDVCKNGACSYASVLSCEDDTPCTTDSCDPAKGCVHSLNTAACDDGNVCTLNDTCAAGVCKGKSTLTCDDLNPCTDDSCDPAAGCKFVPNTASCDDGNACTASDTCVNAACKGKLPVSCTDGNLCTDDWCDPDLGCQHSDNTAPCSDGSLCTQDDACSNGACAPGPMLDCDDGNPCTDDACDLKSGCVHSPNTAACEDGNQCTVNDACAAGACKPGGPLVCKDNNVCTDDSCAPNVGCLFTSNTVGCTDNDACTTSDTCKDSACVPGPKLNCDDGNVCTDDSCSPAAGCVHAPVADNTPCGQDMKCVAGSCLSNCPPGTQTFNYTGGQQTFTVPQGCITVQVEAWGAQGGNRASYSAGGKGGYVKGTLATQSGQTLYVFVGQFPGVGTSPGWNGGGTGDVAGHSEGGGGGGASDVRQGGTGLNDRKIVAGGGGGGGGMHQTWLLGGPGGGATGGAGLGDCPGQGGTQSSGGANGTDSCMTATSSPGSFGVGGGGGSGGCGAGGGGGGGGGWYGGGGGGSCGSGGSGGGGGSSYLGGVTNGTHQQGVNSGNGKVVLSWP